MNERDIEQGIQAEQPRAADPRIQADEPLPLPPPMEIGATKRPRNAKSNRRLWWLAVIGALIGFFATTFDASEKPYACQREWPWDRMFIRGIEKTIEVRHFGLLVFEVGWMETTDTGGLYLWDESLGNAFWPTKDVLDRLNREDAQRGSRQAWLAQIVLMIAWAGLGALLGVMTKNRRH